MNRANHAYGLGGGLNEKIALHDRDENPFGYQELPVPGSIDVVTLYIKQGRGEKKLFYSVVRLGSFDTQKSCMHLVVAAHDGILFPIEVEPGFTSHDLSIKSMTIPDGKRFYLVDDIGLDQFDGDYLRQDIPIDVSRGVRIQFDMVKYNRDSEMTSLKRVRRELQRELESRG